MAGRGTGQWESARLRCATLRCGAGAPCGVMDQMASALGEPGRLLALRCQPAEVEGSVAIPEHVAVWGIDSGGY